MSAIHRVSQWTFQNYAWIASFLCDRTTTLKLQEFTAPSTPIQTGIPQGSPVSPILYLFYNADLIEACKTQDTEAVGYIDIPGSSYTGRGSAMTSTIQRIQRRAAQIITGAFRTTAGAAVDNRPAIRRHASTEVGRSSEQSPLDRFSNILEQKFKVQLDRLEKRIPHVVPPWWIPPFVGINESAEEAIKDRPVDLSALVDPGKAGTIWPVECERTVTFAKEIDVMQAQERFPRIRWLDLVSMTTYMNQNYQHGTEFSNYHDFSVGSIIHNKTKSAPTTMKHRYLLEDLE
ncbi:hypothetical protein N7541_008014 [Penicillium brevicompactum]|uniref:Reverse transcriptase n=1 Tax=Penicillium brevicompactum TaxID=5074 RepID=A0A9W9QY74_PENBR|nr:hypothetical protein N7541_008014 [Penicillium brevicompactum]